MDVREQINGNYIEKVEECRDSALEDRFDILTLYENLLGQYLEVKSAIRISQKLSLELIITMKLFCAPTKNSHKFTTQFGFSTD